MVSSSFPSEPPNVHKRRRADGTRTTRQRKQKLTCRLSDSGFEDDILLSPAPSPDRTAVPPVPQTGQLSWYRQYGDTGYKIQKEKEVHFHSCKSLALQPQLNAEARCRLVSWLIPVHQHLSLSFECCCLTINIMDRFLACTPVAADCFQLLGVTALLLASKQVEVCSPRVSELLSLCCDAFTKEQLCNLECLMLVRLNFRLCAPTLAFFLDCYINFQSSAAPLNRKYDNTRTDLCRKLALKLCELSLADYAFNKYPPSLTARCALQLASDTHRAAQDPPRSPGNVWDSSVKDSDSTHTEASADVMESEYSLMRECINNLRLLASLNQEALTML